MNCKDCKYYEKGFDGKPGICTKLVVADIWHGYEFLLIDGIGYSDEQYDNEFSILYVGENFGCIHFEKALKETTSLNYNDNGK